MLVPWPITVSGPLVVAPALAIPLTAPDSGIVEQVRVREGSQVPAGGPLLHIRNLELEREMVSHQRVADSLAVRSAQARARNQTADMGLLENQVAELKAITADEHGVVVLSGPADSGRTTTLYAVVRMHDAYTRNVQTVELEPQDNVEGVRQTTGRASGPPGRSRSPGEGRGDGRSGEAGPRPAAGRRRARRDDGDWHPGRKEGEVSRAGCCGRREGDRRECRERDE